jgi:hypothetical protein
MVAQLTGHDIDEPLAVAPDGQVRLSHQRRCRPALRPASGAHIEDVDNVEDFFGGGVSANDIQPLADHRATSIEPWLLASARRPPAQIPGLARALFERPGIDDAVPRRRCKIEQPPSNLLSPADDHGLGSELYVPAARYSPRRARLFVNASGP